MVEQCGPQEKLYFLRGSQPKLALEPNGSLSLGQKDIDLRKIKEFCRSNQSEGNLIIGFLSYDLGLHIHNLKPKNKTKLPLVHLYSFAGWVEENNGQLIVNYRDEKFLKTIKRLADRKKKNISRLKTKVQFEPAWSLDRYKLAFNQIKQYIKSGNIYQVNLSYPLKAVVDSDAKDIFSRVQKTNQVDMAGLFQAPDFDIISFSPETFIRVKNQTIETFPIKGTRTKKDNISDKLTAKKLVGDKKEQAELNMITDLLRNDLSIVCKPASVNIKSHQNTTQLNRVIHTFSHISGELLENTSSIGALLRVFPGGSISGCPKKRALEIIDELEEYSRGPYCGSLFTLDPEDNLEANILIRTLIKKDSSVSLPVGGGIVFDSDLKREYQETLDKSLSITKAF